MITYPISIARNNYRGSNPLKGQRIADEFRIANELERAINNVLLAQSEPIRRYTYYEISQLTGYDADIVRNLCFSIDGGHGGFTAYRHDMTYDQAESDFLDAIG